MYYRGMQSGCLDKKTILAVGRWYKPNREVWRVYVHRAGASLYIRKKNEDIVKRFWPLSCYNCRLWMLFHIDHQTHRFPRKVCPWKGFQPLLLPLGASRSGLGGKRDQWVRKEARWSRREKMSTKGRQPTRKGEGCQLLSWATVGSR